MGSLFAIQQCWLDLDASVRVRVRWLRALAPGEVVWTLDRHLAMSWQCPRMAVQVCEELRCSGEAHVHVVLRDLTPAMAYQELERRGLA